MLNLFSDMELEIIINGTVKTIRELQIETKKNYPEIVLFAVRNELDNKYSWYYNLIKERNIREDLKVSYVG